MSILDTAREINSAGLRRWLIHGFPNSGKTSLIGNGVGSSTLIIRPPTEQVVSVTVKPFPQEIVVNDWAEFSELTEELMALPPGKLEWVWLDSISAFQDIGLDHIWRDELARNPHRIEYGMSKGEYGRNMERIMQHVRTLHGARGFHFGITAHSVDLPNPNLEEDADDTESPATILMPWVQGKQMSSNICGYQQAVFYLFRRRRESGGFDRVLTTRESEHWFTSDKAKALPGGQLINPTFADLVAAFDSGAPVTSARRPTRRRIVKK